MDAGTAVTVDAVQANGTHLGGLILPGLQLLGDALVRRTQASHMSAALLDDPQIFTNNTLQGMGSGCLFALVGALEGIVNACRSACRRHRSFSAVGMPSCCMRMSVFRTGWLPMP
ncbi:MAG: type III pantothenate kinase [Thiolinea sp.]